jgi:N-acetylglucosamine-6-sulfatase
MPPPRAARPLHRRRLTAAGARLPRLGFTLPACVAILEAACGGSSATPSIPVPTPTPGPPSIVFILADDLDMQSMPYMPKALSLIANEGVTFTNSFVATSLCAPSRATILTGQYAHNHGTHTDKGEHGGYGVFAAGGRESSTIATWLRAAGYRTILLGKYVNGYPSGSPTYVPPGWDDWHGDFGANDGDESGLVYYDYSVNDNGTVTQHGESSADYLTDVLTAKALSALKQVPDGQPFFMYVAPPAPHMPAIRAPREAGLFGGLTAPRTPTWDEGDMTGKPDWLRAFPPFTAADVAAIDTLFRDRLACLQAVDDMIDQLVQELTAEGRLANTYLVLASDNGFILGPHRFTHGKEAPYEESIRVPLLVRGPDIPAGQHRDGLVQNVDYAPTFVEWARASSPDLDGRSLAQLLATGSTSDWRHDVLLEHWKSHTGAAAIPDFSGLRTDDYAYVEYATGEVEVYDIRNDPYEHVNQFDAHPTALVQQLSDRVAALKGCRGSSCR